MLRDAVKLLVLCGTLFGAAAALLVWRSSHSTEADLQRERERTTELRQMIERLTTERRVADIVVTKQETVDGRQRTSLLFVEYADDGSALPAKRFTITGDLIHIDAMVIKFDGRFVEENDELRGRSVALFTRIYGDTQAPSDGFFIDRPGEIPDVYRGDGKAVGPFVRTLWRDFWRLADDAEYRAQTGVRIAQGEGVWRTFEPGRLYTLTLEANGGLNIRSEPLKGIYREAIDPSQSSK